MKINKDILKDLKPCEDRYKNFLIYYSDFDGSFDEFIDLKNVTYLDKIWVAKHLLSKNQLVHFGLLCAKSVLYLFEEKYPSDKRVRECIEYLQTIPNFESLSENELVEIKKHRAAANAAASAAADAVYAASAYAASAAADAAYAAASAAVAAAYSVDAAYAAVAAAYSVDAAYVRKNQELLNLQFLKMAASL